MQYGNIHDKVFYYSTHIKKREGASHLPRIGACAATPCNCPVPTAFPVPPGIQLLSTIQPTSHLHLILIQLVFSN